MTALGNTVLHLQLVPAPTVHLLTPAKGPEGQVTAELLSMLQATAALAVEAPGARPHTQRVLAGRCSVFLAMLVVSWQSLAAVVMRPGSSSHP